MLALEAFLSNGTVELVLTYTRPFLTMRPVATLLYLCTYLAECQMEHPLGSLNCQCSRYFREWHSPCV